MGIAAYLTDSEIAEYTTALLRKWIITASPLRHMWQCSQSRDDHQSRTYRYSCHPLTRQSTRNVYTSDRLRHLVDCSVGAIEGNEGFCRSAMEARSVDEGTVGESHF
jgi:hypothetical protein